MSGPFRKLLTTLGVVLCLGLASPEKYSAGEEPGPDSSGESGFSVTPGAEPPSLIYSPQESGRESDALVAKLEHAGHRFQDVAFSPDGKLLAAGYGFHDDGGVTLWNVADRKVVASLLDAKDGVDGIARVAFSPDGKWFAAATGDGDVMLWATDSWRAHKTVIEEAGSPNALGFSPQGDRLAFSSDEAVVLYDLQSGRARVLAETKETYDTSQDVSFSPDGKVVAVYGRDAFQFRDAGTGELIKTLKTGGTGFFGRFLPGGGRLIAGGGAVYGDKSVEIWDIKDEKKVRELSEFRGGLFSLAVSHSGKLFAVAGGNYGSGGDLSLWDLEEGRELGFTSFGGMPIQGVAFSPDDRLLAAASEDGFVLLYAVDRLRGPELKRQTRALCGEVAVEEGRTFIRPLSKGPGGMVNGFEYAWKIEVANAEVLAGAAGVPVVLNDWTIESSAARDRARIGDFRPLLARGRSSEALSDYAVFGNVMNPGWDKGFVAKVYGDGSFVAASNSGDCLAYGSLAGSGTTPDFESLKKRLVSEGLLSIPKEPLALGASHYRTRFIGLASAGAEEMRSDAEDIRLLMEGGPAKKREAFSSLYAREEQFVNSLLRAGLKPPKD